MNYFITTSGLQDLLIMNSVTNALFDWGFLKKSYKIHIHWTLPQYTYNEGNCRVFYNT